MQSLCSNRGANQAILALVAVICIAAGAYFIFKHAKSGEDDLYGDVYYYCTSCEKEFPDSSSNTPPIKCPFCNKPTGVLARKFKCKECETEFIAYIQKYDPETKLLIERRKRGDSVPDAQIRSILVTEPDTEDWVDASSPEGTDLMNNVFCPNECEGDLEPLFPKPKK